MGTPFRFLHAADLHLDSPFKGLEQVPAVIRAFLRDAAFRALDRLVETAIREQVHFVLLAGDTYDLADRSLRAQLRFQRAMQQLAEHRIRVYIVHGNHDPMDGQRANLAFPDLVYTFAHDRPELVVVNGRNGEPLAEICGYSYPTAAVTENISLAYRSFPSAGLFRIGLLHANVDGDPEHDNYAACSKNDLLSSGVQYWAFGHVHHRAVLHERPYVVYPGNIQGRHIREAGAKGCYLADVSEEGEVTLHFHALDDCRWEQRELPIAGLSDEQALKDALDDSVREALRTAQGRSVVLRLTLSGRGPLHRLLLQPSFLAELTADYRELAAERASGGEPFAWLESVRTQTGSPLDWEQLNHEDSFLGNLWRMSNAIAADPREAQSFAAEAWGALLDHPQSGRLLQAELEERAEQLFKNAREFVAETLFDDGE